MFSRWSRCTKGFQLQGRLIQWLNNVFRNLVASIFLPASSACGVVPGQLLRCQWAAPLQKSHPDTVTFKRRQKRGFISFIPHFKSKKLYPAAGPLNIPLNFIGSACVIIKLREPGQKGGMAMILWGFSTCHLKHIHPLLSSVKSSHLPVGSSLCISHVLALLFYFALISFFYKRNTFAFSK